MLVEIQKSIIKWLMQKSFQSDKELHLHLVSIIAAVFCLAIHLFHLIIFLLWDIPLFAGFNVGSVLLYSGMFFLIQRRAYTAVGLLLSGEVLAYTTLFALQLGIGSYILGYFLLVLMLQLLYPYGCSNLRAAVAVFTLLLINICLFFRLQSLPAVELSPGLERLLVVSNVNFLVVGTMLQLYLSNLVQRMMINFSDVRVEELSSQLHTDPLTGLYNRRFASSFFDSVISSAPRRSRCVAMLDIDDFKRINDSYGHACGDEVLRFFSGFLQENLRKTDVIFRWGGEEFLIVLDAANPHEAYAVLEKLRRRLAQTRISLVHGDIAITFTSGVCALNESDPYQSIEESDQMLYVGKQKGKNIVVTQQYQQ